MVVLHQQSPLPLFAVQRLEQALQKIAPAMSRKDQGVCNALQWQAATGSYGLVEAT